MNTKLSPTIALQETTLQRVPISVCIQAYIDTVIEDDLRINCENTGRDTTVHRVTGCKSISNGGHKKCLNFPI